MKSKILLIKALFLLISFLVSSNCIAVLTVECVPVGTVAVTGGAQIDIECLVSSDIIQSLRGSQIDMPCQLSPLATGEGAMTVISFTTDPDADGGSGPSSNGFPYLYGTAGIPVFNPVDCTAGGVSGTGSPVTIGPGKLRYLGTFTYQVSECAVGSFNIALENFSDPPQETDATRFRDHFTNGLVPINVIETNLTIATIACCLPGAKCADLGAECCENLGGGFGPVGSSCESSADTDGDTLPDLCDPCPADTLNDSDGDGVCDSDDLCPGEDDTLDANDDQVPDCLQKIPTISAWGLVVLALAFASAGKLHNVRRARSAK